MTDPKVPDDRTAQELWTWLSECLTCGEVHTFHDGSHDQCEHCGRSGPASLWASPVDGHGYRQRGRLHDINALRAQWAAM